MWPAGVEPARPAFQAGALPVGATTTRYGRGWTRTSDLLFVRQALSRLSYSPVEGSGTRTRTSISTFRAWRPAALDDPRLQSRTSVHLPHRRSTQLRDLDFSVTSGRNRTMFSKPLAYSSTLDRSRCDGNVLRGGVLEPGPRRPPENAQAKAHAYFPALFQRQTPRAFLSQAGPRFGSRACSS